MKARCIICDKDDQWENVDQYRLKKSGMSICNGCGFVTYPDRLLNEKEMIEHYREAYRPPPAIGNLHTGQLKLHYHGHFLKDLFDEWKESKKKPVFCDIGAAFGLYLSWARSIFKEGKFYGTELTKSFRRVAFHEYKLKLDEEFNKEIKYDLISTYKVAEHQIDADIKLRECVESLSDDGYIYIGVPIWFKTMHNFGVSGWDIEYYYHPDHINAWTEKLFETMLKKVGLEIVKKNDTYYDNVYLCKRNDFLMSKAPVYEDPEEIKKNLAAIKKADEYFKAGEYGKAINEWPNFPQAYATDYERNRKFYHKEGLAVIEGVMNKAMENCPSEASVYNWAADIYMRYEKYDIAMKLLGISNDMKPENPLTLYTMSNCFRCIANKETDAKKRNHYIVQARELCRHLVRTNEKSKPDMMSQVFADSASIPMVGE